MPASLMSKDEVIVKLVKVFRQHGYDGATLARLSEATKLGRASLYHHFPQGKREMATAVLNHMNNWLNECVLMPLRGSGTPKDRLYEMSTSLDKFYSHGQEACLLAMLTIGESHDLFYAQIRKALNLWIDTLAEVLVEAGIKLDQARNRSEDAIIQIQGALVLARGLGNTAPFERVVRRLPEDLLET